MGIFTPFSWKSALALSLVAFVCGVTVGAAGSLHYVANKFPPFREQPERMPGRIASHLRGQLNLDAAQTEEVRRVFDRGLIKLREVRKGVQPQLDTVAGETFDEVNAVLEPRQREKWRVWFEMMRLRFTPPEFRQDPPDSPSAP